MVRVAHHGIGCIDRQSIIPRQKVMPDLQSRSVLIAWLVAGCADISVAKEARMPAKML